MNESISQNHIRLNRYLAQCGVASRRECDSYIAAGKVKVNGKKVTELGTRINPEKDEVSYSGKKVRPVSRKIYIAYHKSRGSLVTVKDPQGRKTIYDDLRKGGLSADTLKYVGRLDRNSEGLLLLTNDGDLVHALTHPRFHIKKVYEVRIDKPLQEVHADQMLSAGVESNGQILHAGALRTSRNNSRSGFWYEIDLYEGKNRQIRRMFEELGYTVLRLKRTQFSVVTLRDLKRGAFRYLQEREVKGLKNKGFRKK